jgi:ABC-type arginine transport system permease subunit
VARKGMKAVSLIIKLLLVVAIIGVLVIAYTTCSGTPLVQKIDKTLPAIDKAPYEVSTMTNIYYAGKAMVNNDKSVTMSSWYERIKNKWVVHKEPITLLPVLHPNISKRTP